MWFRGWFHGRLLVIDDSFRDPQPLGSVFFCVEAPATVSDSLPFLLHFYTIFTPLLHHFYSTFYSTFTPRLLHFYSTFTPLLLHFYSTFTPPLLHLYSTFTPRLLHFLLHFYSTFTPLLLHCYSTFTPLLLQFTPSLLVLLSVFLQLSGCGDVVRVRHCRFRRWAFCSLKSDAFLLTNDEICTEISDDSLCSFAALPPAEQVRRLRNLDFLLKTSWFSIEGWECPIEGWWIYNQIAGGACNKLPRGPWL